MLTSLCALADRTDGVWPLSSMARGCNRKPRVSWGALCWEAKLACERWAGPGGIQGKVQSRESVQCDKCDKLRAPPAGPGLWLAGSLQDSGSGHVEARGSSERRGAAGAVGGSALPAEGEAVRTWSTHRRIGPLMGCLLLEVGEQWLVTFLLGLREASSGEGGSLAQKPFQHGPLSGCSLDPGPPGQPCRLAVARGGLQAAG